MWVLNYLGILLGEFMTKEQREPKQEDVCFTLNRQVQVRIYIPALIYDEDAPFRVWERQELWLSLGGWGKFQHGWANRCRETLRTEKVEVNPHRDKNSGSLGSIQSSQKDEWRVMEEDWKRIVPKGMKVQVVWHLLCGQKLSPVVWLLLLRDLVIITSWNKLDQENKPVSESETLGLQIDLDAGISSPPSPSLFPLRVTAEIQSRGKAGSRDSRRSLASCGEVAVSDIPLSPSLCLLSCSSGRTLPDHN